MMAAPVEQKTQSSRGRGVRYVVPVIDNQRDRVGVLVDLVDESLQHITSRVIAALLKHLPQGRGKARADPLERLQKMRKERDHIVVVIVNAQPRDRDSG